VERDTSIQVIYIVSNAHSGSTLLDMILGSGKGCFSAGELAFITRDTIMEEYCSCENKISECEVWTEILKEWETEREISYQQYQDLFWRYERKKTFFRALGNRFRPSVSFKKYCQATQQLFQTIQKVTGCSVIIDSSKSPQRIPVLSNIVDVQVIHLCRNFTGVLNSFKRSSTKDIKAGIEEDNPPGRTWKVLLDWIFTNFAAEIFGLGVKSQKILYKNYVQEPKILQEVHSFLGHLEKDQSFSAPHMLAGNTLRLKGELKINSKVGFEYKLLNTKQLKFAKAVDELFPFWS